MEDHVTQDRGNTKITSVKTKTKTKTKIRWSMIQDQDLQKVV